MTLLFEAVDEKKFDVRMTERNQARGVITADDLDKVLKKIPDDAEYADWVNIEGLVNDEQSPSVTH